MSKILIADDSKVMLKMIRNAILNDECNFISFSKDDILFAEDGLKAFEMLGSNADIDYLISDINMPGLNGYELLEVLEDTGLLKSTKVIFCSGEVLKPVKNRSVIGFLKKPMKSDKMALRLNDIFKKEVQRQKHFDAKKRHIDEHNAKLTSHIIQLVKNYFVAEKISDTCDEHKLSCIIGEYSDPLEEIIESELLDISTAVMTQVFDEIGVDAGINLEKLNFLYEKLTNDDTKKLSKMNSTELEVAFDLQQELMVIRSNFVKNKRVFNEKLLGNSLFVVEEFLLKIDYSIESKKLSTLKERYKNIKFLTSQLNTIAPNSKNRDNKLWEVMMEDFTQKYPQDPYKALEKFIEIALHYYQDTLNRLLYLYEMELWRSAKTSKEIQNFFKTKHLSSPFYSKTIISYIIKYSEDDNIELKHALRYLEKEQRRSVAILTRNEIEVVALQEIIKSVDYSWNIRVFVRPDVAKKWLKKHRSDILIYDSDFISTEENEFLRSLLSDARHLRNSRILFLDNKITSQEIEDNSKFFSANYINRPIKAERLVPILQRA